MKVHIARDALVEAALEYDAVARWTGQLTAEFEAACDSYRAAVSAQSIAEAEGYVAAGASRASQQAYAAAMIGRPTLRRLVYLWISDACSRGFAGMTDRHLEVKSQQYRGCVVDGIRVPRDGYSHQSISSARKSLVDAGVLRANGEVVIGKRPHTIWTVTSTYKNGASDG